MKTTSIDGIAVQDFRLVVDAQGVTLYLHEGIIIKKPISHEAVLTNFVLVKCQGEAYRTQKLKGEIMNTTRLTRGVRILLEEANKAFNDGAQDRGISFLNDGVEMLTNGLKTLAEQPAEQPAEQAKQPSADHVSAEQAAKAEAERAAEPPAEQMPEPPKDELAEQMGLIEQPAEQPATETKPGDGVVSEPAESEDKPGSGILSEPPRVGTAPGSGIISEPDESETKPGSGVT